MLLVVDSGNTNTVFAVYEGEECRGVWRCGSNPRRTADEYAVWLIDLMALENMNRDVITDAIVSSVVPEGNFNLTTLCQRYFKCNPMFIGEENCDLGIKALIDRPDQVGADRLVNTVAVHGRYDGDLIVVDFGTATTFDVVDRDGNYCGGVICPGINVSLDALYMATAQLPRIDIKATTSIIGKATIPAMQSGIFWGYIGMIEGLVDRIRKEYGAEMTVVATGGLAPLFAEATDVIDHVYPDMTLRGLVEVHKRNQPQ
jgi:type III pantothenate kinase